MKVIVGAMLVRKNVLKAISASLMASLATRYLLQFMFVRIKRIIKPIRRQDFYYPSGEPVPKETGFQWHGAVASKDADFPYYGFCKFKNIPISGLQDLEKHGLLIVRRRIEIKIELRRTFRKGNKVSSQTWHLASILERDTADSIKCQSFWNKIEDKLKTFELKDTESKAIREKIAAVVPNL